MPFLLPGFILTILAPPIINPSRCVTDITFDSKLSFKDFKPKRFARENGYVSVIFENNNSRFDLYFYSSTIKGDLLLSTKKAYLWRTPVYMDENGFTAPSGTVDQIGSFEIRLLNTSKSSTLFSINDKYYVHNRGIVKELDFNDVSSYNLLVDNKIVWLTSEDQGNLAINFKSADSDVESVNIPNFGWLSLDFLDQSFIRVAQDKVAFFARCSYQYLTTKFLCILDLQSKRIIKRIAIDGGPLSSGHGYPLIRSQSLCYFDGNIYYLGPKQVIRIDPQIDSK